MPLKQVAPMVKTMRKKKEIAEYQMKKRDKLSFREEIKVLLRNTMNRLENKTLIMQRSII